MTRAASPLSHWKTWGFCMDLATTRVCIFDVNGVLIDSNVANARAMGCAFSEDPAVRERIAVLYLQLTGIDRGTKIRILQERVIGKPLEEGEFDLRWARFTEFGRSAMRDAPLPPGVKDVLKELGRRKILRAALSNTPPALLQEILATHGLDSLLDVVRGGGDWPKTESLARMLSEFRLKPGECLFFGDGKGDLAAARYSGVPFAAIDPGTGEFRGESGFDGPYQNLAQWASTVFGSRSVI